MDWDDVRHFLATAQEGSFRAAGDALGVNTTTVSRRVAQLESQLKATLFVRAGSRLELTAAGQRIMAAALDAQAAIQDLAGEPSPAADRGTVRLGATEGFGTHLLAPALVALRNRKPALNVELAAFAGYLSPLRREVDVAITLYPPSDPRLVVEHLADYQLALYAAPDYLEAHPGIGTVSDLSKARVVGYIPDLIYTQELDYLGDIAAHIRADITSSSILAQRQFILAGGGVGVLPCFLADGLIRVAPDVLLTRRFWVSTHREIASTARVRAVLRWLDELVATLQPKLMATVTPGTD